MHADGTGGRSPRRARWAIWIAAGTVAALLTVRALNDDAVEVLDDAHAALRAAATALDHTAGDIDAASGVQRERTGGDVGPVAVSTAAQQAESAAQAARRASTETRAAVTRVERMRMDHPGTFAEVLASVQALRDAARALMAAAEALRDAAEALRDAGALRAARRALMAADDTIDAADAVVRAAEAALDSDERFNLPPPQPSDELAAHTVRRESAAQKTAPTRATPA